MNLRFSSAKAGDEVFCAAVEEAGLGFDVYDLVDDEGRAIRGAEDEHLSTKVVVIGNPDAKHTVWISTGIHGVERLAGTLFLCWLLAHVDWVSEFLGRNIRIVLIDNLNPWGASFYTRFNEKNIDPNRNFRNFKPGGVIRRRILPKLYAKIDSELNPESLSLVGEISRLKRLLDFRKTRGDPVFEKIVKVGQRVSQDKMFFVGNEPTWTNLTLREIIRRYSVMPEGHDVHLDIHTGLGESIAHADPVLVTIYKPETEEQRRAKFFFGDGVLSSRAVNGLTSSSLGTIENAFLGELPLGRIYTGVCLEYGTIPVMWVGIFLRWRFHALNKGRWQRKGGLGQLITRKLIKDAFIPDSIPWRRAVPPKTWTVLERVILRLRNLDEVS